MTGDGARPRVAVVAVTYNAARDVAAFLDSLDVLGDSSTVQTVVVDNASSDDTVDIARAHRRRPQVVESGGNLGYSAGVNRGAALVPDEVPLLVANPDVRLRPGFLEPLLAVIDDPAVGVATPRLVGDGEVVQPTLRRDPALRRTLAEAVLGGRRAARLGWGEVVAASASPERPCDVDWAVGALLLVAPRARRQVGPWDESFFLYSEETEYLQRVRRHGFVVRHVPAAVAYHRGGDSHVNPALWSTLVANRVRLYAREHGERRARAFHAAVVLNEAVRAPRSRTHRAALRLLLEQRAQLVSSVDRGPGAADAR